MASPTNRNSASRFTNSVDFPKSATNRRKPFVPLKDLLQRNHDDGVREYLDKMKGLSIDEIVNTQILVKQGAAATQRANTPDKPLQGEGNGMFGGPNSPVTVRGR